MVDQFESIVATAMESRTEEAFENLLDAVCKLPYLYLLMSPSDETSPFVGQLDEKLWLFLYSSPDEISKHGSFIVGEGKPLYFTRMQTDSAIPWLLKWERHGGVYGIRFNEGPYGFYFKLNDLQESPATTTVQNQESHENLDSDQEEHNQLNEDVTDEVHDVTNQKESEEIHERKEGGFWVVNESEVKN